MAIMKDSQTPATEVGRGIERKVIHTETMTTAVVFFSDGPHTAPIPFHSHPHEQITYVAEGELYVLLGEDKERLTKGDLFSVPPNMPHTVQILSEAARLIDSFSPVREDLH